MLKFKIDVMAELEKAGITVTMARETGVLSQGTITKLKAGDTSISLATLNTLCCILEMQPRDIVKYVETDEDDDILKKISKSS